MSKKKDKNIPLEESFHYHSEDYKEYEVEKIIKHRKNKKTGKIEYFIKWKGYSDKFNSWEPENNLEHCQAILKEFRELNKKSNNKIITHIKNEYNNKDDNNLLNTNEIIELESSNSEKEMKKKLTISINKHTKQKSICDFLKKNNEKNKNNINNKDNNNNNLNDLVKDIINNINDEDNNINLNDEDFKKNSNIFSNNINNEENNKNDENIIYSNPIPFYQLKIKNKEELKNCKILKIRNIIPLSDNDFYGCIYYKELNNSNKILQCKISIEDLILHSPFVFIDFYKKNSIYINTDEY